ncbi:hypothetical protein PspLS_08175 [Pyricularia sp. CBS 133598]|nr:hypothetical protein PspLS_08175 [Pyricularia sp. CBS 133598]
MHGDHLEELMRNPTERGSLWKGLQEMVHAKLEASSSSAVELTTNIANGLSRRLEASIAEGEFTTDLMDWLQKVFAQSTLEALYGPDNALSQNSRHVESIWTMSEGLKRLTMWPFASFTVRTPTKMREEIVCALANYFEQNDVALDGHCDLVQSTAKFVRQHNMSTDFAARYSLALLVGFVINTAPAVYWLIGHIATDKQLMSIIRAELDRVVETTDSGALTVSTDRLRTECPYLSGDGGLVERIRDQKSEWHEVCVKDIVTQLVARLSARIFLGDEGARNDAWLKITREYTVNGYIAASILRMFPVLLRPLANQILPRCRELRAQIVEARKIVTEIVDRRRKVKAAARREGRPVPVFSDAVEWWEQDSKDEDSGYDPVIGQLVLSQSSIHTTTDFLTQVIVDIAEHPKVKDPLIQEVQQATTKSGWSKLALYDMRLTESVLKESQRMKPIARCTMNRMVIEDVQLSDGTLLPKQTLLGVSVDRMWDESVYENPHEWDGWRFYKKYQQSPDARDVSIVNTGPNYLAWGHGKLACAGRFFVAQEAKVALAHLLLKYDWEVVSSPADTKFTEFGLVLASNPKARIRIRKRV